MKKDYAKQDWLKYNPFTYKRMDIMLKLSDGLVAFVLSYLAFMLLLTVGFAATIAYAGV